MKVVAVYNSKGGVGKTTAAVNLAWLASADRRTLLWDLDPQAAATWLLKVKPKVKGGAGRLVQGKTDAADLVKQTDRPRLDVLPGDASYRNLDLALDDTKDPTRRLARVLEGVRKSYDVVVLDCPPSTSLVSEGVLRASDVLVVPLVPTPLSLRTFDQLQDLLAETGGKGPEVLAFFSMVDRRKTLHRMTVQTVPTERKQVTGICVPAASVVEQMSVRREPVVAFAPASPAAQAYAELWGATRRLL